MEIVYFLFLSIGLMTTKVSPTKTTLRYFKDGRTWHEAQTTCSSNNGKLMIPDATTLGKLTQTCPIAMNETVWVGEYTSLSEWIEIIGCYEAWNTDSSFQYTTNDPLLCVHLCQNYTYFGMKADKCICIDQTVNNTATKTNSQNCSTSCTGRTDVFCGGNSSVNIYRKVIRQITEEPKTNCTRIDCFCVSADCQTIGNQQQTAYFSRPCSNDLTTVCDNYVSVTGDAPSWKEAIQRCVEQQNSYPVNSDSSTSLCNKTVITWTSIFRDVFIAIDNTGLPLSNIQGCKRMDLTKSSSGSSLGNCTKLLPFVCEIVLKPGQSEDMCVPTTTPIPTTETMTSTSTDVTTSTIEPTSSSSLSQETTTVVQSTTTRPQTTAGPLPVPSTQTGPVIGASVAAVIVLLLIILVVVILMRRKRTKDDSFVTYGNDNKRSNLYVENPVVGNSKRNTYERSKIQSQELVMPVKQETLTVEGQVPQNPVQNVSVRTTDENKVTESVHSKNEQIESKNEKPTMIIDREDEKKNVFHQQDNVSDVNNKSKISTNIGKQYNDGKKNDKVENLGKSTEKQRVINLGENSTPSAMGGSDTGIDTTLGSDETNYASTTRGDGKSNPTTTGGNDTSRNAGTNYVTITGGDGKSYVTTTGSTDTSQSAGTENVTITGGHGKSYVTTTGVTDTSRSAGTNYVTITGGDGKSYDTTTKGTDTSRSAGTNNVTTTEYKSDVTTAVGDGKNYVTTIGGDRKNYVTTIGSAGTNHVTKIGGSGTSNVTKLEKQHNSVGVERNNVINPGVDARNKQLNIDKPTPGSYTSVINIKM